MSARPPVSRSQSGAQQLLVFVPPRRSWPGGARGALSSATVLQYVLIHPNGRSEAGSAALGALPAVRAMDLVFDVLDVYSTTFAAPKLPDVKMRQALPNLLEERMLVDTVDCHFAWNSAGRLDTQHTISSATGSAWLSVAAIERTTLARTLEAFALAQRHPRAAYSALYTLPPPDRGAYCVRIDQGRDERVRGTMRTGPDQACTFDLDDGALAMLTLAKRQLGLSRLRVFGAGADALQPAAYALGLELEHFERPIDPTALIDAVNLLQGSYATAAGFGKVGRWVSKLARDGRLQVPAVWGAICAVVAIIGLNAYWFKLDAQYTDVRNSMNHAFLDAFPNERTVSDAVAQAKRDVTQLRARAGRPSADDFSVLNAQAVKIFANAPVGIVTSIHYSDGAYVVHCKPGALDDAGLRNSLQSQAAAFGINLRTESDGALRLTPVGG